MDPTHNSKSPFSYVFFLLLLLSTNFVTFFFSTAFYSTSCTPYDELDTATTISTVDAPVISQAQPVQDELQTTPDLPPEFLAFTSAQKLPFGFNTNVDSDKIFLPVGRACTLFPDELRRYMSYTVNGCCPDDELLAQKLLLRGREPLHRRRCRLAAQRNMSNLILFLIAYGPHREIHLSFGLHTLARTTHVSSIVCIIRKVLMIVKIVLILEAERKLWTAATTNAGSLDFSIDEVLATKKPGTIRIGLDIGGGVATFAVRMRERNITMLTTSMNLNGPINSFIASRRVIPLYISISQRLPFFDNTLDIVHSMHVLSNWIPTTLLHFLFFDIYRVHRPGGLFWLDHFFCVGEQVKWVVGRKLDRGPELREMCLSAIITEAMEEFLMIASFPFDHFSNFG